jgi:hypothetical protein
VSGLWFVVGAIALGLQMSCAYRLPAPRPPGHYRLRLVDMSPERFVLRTPTMNTKEYQVPADGRVTLDVPRSRRGCSVYLFNWIRVSSGYDPFAAKTVDLSTASGPRRKLSFNELFKLPQDAEGYHLLSIGK